MTRALEGILVVALEQAVAAPYCSARLADAGARVIKIERDTGDFARAYDHAVHGESAYFVWLNRGKESLVLDLKERADRGLLERILEGADVFIQNLAPGAAARAGFDSSALRAKYSRLITCDISGYGEKGPYRDMKAYDLLIQCETGLASITGGPAEPGRVGVSVADICCGMNAYAAILQALYQRARSGRGSGVAVSLFDSLADWMTVPLLHQDYAGRPPARVGLNHPSIAPYGAYGTSEGQLTVLAIQNEREWDTFCRIVIQDAELATDTRFATNALRCENRAALDERLRGAIDAISREQLVERLRAANVAFGRLNSVADLSVHPQLRRVEAATPSGPVALPAWPARWHDASQPAAAVPALGEHSHALRLEFASRDAG